MNSATPQRLQTAAGICWAQPEVAGDAGMHQGDVPKMIERILGAWPRGFVLKRDHRSVVRRVEVDGARWIVKGYRLGTVKAALYGALRQTPAWREWRGAQVLHDAGLRAARPIALVPRDPTGECAELLLLPFIEGLTLDSFIAAQPSAPRDDKASAAQRLLIARHVGDQIRAMTAAGFINRDHKASNLIVDALCRSGAQPPLVIDAGGLRRYRGAAQLRRVLALLWETAAKAGPITRREAAACRGAARGSRRRRR
jgi:hypothetical protein